MGFRQDLDLSGFIDKYQPFIAGDDSTINYVDGKITEKDPWENPEPIPRHLYDDRPRPGSGPEPDLVGSGPLLASTSRVLALAGPTFAWDPNRYYRDLGIEWPYVNATRRDLTRGFMEAGGQDDHWLMYCLKQLLNPVVRAEYDATPLGKEYLDDIFVQQRKRHEAADEANRRSRDGDYTTVDEILDEQGYVRLTPEEEAEMERMRALDEATSSGQDGAVGGPWLYSYYLWRTTHQDTDLLAQWQAALIRMADKDIPAIAVGLMGKQPHRFVIGEADGEVIVYLNRNESVTDELALDAVSALKTS